MSNAICKYCGTLKSNDVHSPHSTSECSTIVAVRQMKALESIADSFSRMIKEEYYDEEPSEVRIVGDGTGPDPMWAKFRRD